MVQHKLNYFVQLKIFAQNFVFALNDEFNMYTNLIADSTKGSQAQSKKIVKNCD